VAHLGYVQIDTINVIERSHHHILRTRIPSYRRSDLRQAQSVDKTVFEYWTHALSYVPAKDLRFFLPAMKRHRREGHKCSTRSALDMRKVLRLIRRDGALTIRDIDDDVLTEKQHLWPAASRRNGRCKLAFYTGVLTVSERNGMLKTYELMARHFGWTSRPINRQNPLPRPKPPPICSTAPFARKASLAWIRSAISTRPQARDPAPDRSQDTPQRVGAGRAGRRRQAGALGAPRDAGAIRRECFAAVHILSPFDPLVIQRKRTELFLRLRSSLRGVRAEGEALVRLFRAAGAGRRTISSPPSISRPTARPANLLVQEMELGWRRHAEGCMQGIESAASRKSCTASSGFSWRSERRTESCIEKNAFQRLSFPDTRNFNSSTSTTEISATVRCWPRCSRSPDRSSAGCRGSDGLTTVFGNRFCA